MCTKHMHILCIHIQWNLSVTDTLGTEYITVCCTEVTTIFRYYFVCITIYLDPENSVIERFSLLGEFVIGGYAIYTILHVYVSLFFVILAPDQNGVWLYSVGVI